MPAIVHWDLENLPVKRGVTISSVWLRIREHVQAQFGAILGAYAYADPQTLSLERRTELANSGLDLIDCKSSKPNAVDFRIITRSFAAVVAGGSGVATVAISGDGDFAYSLSTLRNLGLSTMLVFDMDRREVVNNALLQCAEHVWGLSFGGRADEPDEPLVPEMPSVADAAPPAPETAAAGDDDQCFLQAVERAPVADDGNWRNGTSVGELFHRLRGSSEGTKNARQARFRAARERMLAAGRVETRRAGGAVFVRIPPSAPQV